MLTLKLRSRNEISPLVYKNESWSWARKLKQVFVHGRRVQIYLKREASQTFAFNSFRVIHPEFLPCLTFLWKKSPLKLFTLPWTRAVSADRHPGAEQHPGTSCTPCISQGIHRDFFPVSTVTALRTLTSLGSHYEISALLSPALLSNRLQSHLLPVHEGMEQQHFHLLPDEQPLVTPRNPGCECITPCLSTLPSPGGQRSAPLLPWQHQHPQQHPGVMIACWF